MAIAMRFFGTSCDRGLVPIPGFGQRIRVEILGEERAEYGARESYAPQEYFEGVVKMPAGLL